VLAKEYGLSQPTIFTILLNKDKIKSTRASDASSKMIKGKKDCGNGKTAAALDLWHANVR
jgi:hypothetical protein